ncbi:hypothetical protein RF679_06260 [Undibacterium cyanobacteriorum]|uniref:Uncharacterized protein n=1 Tax=Undibacterium cyanobacteriorum TaxID=3073561 RepID=A0ABY9RL02_9BURK|nr:hypothetical protein [Undibacterium sp. 20NA77.5]WMW81884.1 hypothetical protein RF679_06260 [Undibacterium sp. 20NA77.5]
MLTRMWRHLCAVALLSAGFMASTAALAERGPATAEEKEKVVKLAAAADKDPLGVMRSADGRWFQKWSDDVPDYMFGPDVGAFWFHNGVAKEDLMRVLRFHHMLSVAAFQVQKNMLDPEKNPTDLEAKTIAGIEGLLRAYESLVKTNPNNKVAAIDELLVTRDKGGLADFVKRLPPLPKR